MPLALPSGLRQPRHRHAAEKPADDGDQLSQHDDEAEAPNVEFKAGRVPSQPKAMAMKSMASPAGFEPATSSLEG
jgi:hypothetical protein